MLGNAFKSRQKTENDREKGHEDGEQNGRENTTNDARDRIGKTTKPVKPTIGGTQLWDVRQGTNERNWECPEDDLENVDEIRWARTM